MIKIAVQNLEGKKVEDLDLSEDVFGVKQNDALLHQVYVAIGANQRVAIAHTKDKSERAGSGKKPFRQKGTGSARQGQKRNPLMRGGGVAFGPTSDRNFKKDVNRKMRQKAVRIALSDKVRSGELVVVDKLALASAKTKEFAKALASLKIEKAALVAFDVKERDVQICSRNIPTVSNIMTKDLNVYDVLNHKYVVMSKESIKFLEDKFAQEK